MNYDGYGRLQAKQVPEQSAATTYAYNSDDTLLSVSDGRGAAIIYARNGRHLITGISYTVPSGSGIPVPASVSYSYDAAGNRIEMIDGLGSATYAYNSLSRITSETRNITQASPSSYTISYQYNLAGQLMSITDPNNNTINYARDLTGRTSAITGTAINGVSTYISSMSYRAWGAVKQVNYGNGRTLNATYNDRLKAETFQISGLMSKTYEYYNDGTLKFSSEALDHRFDRLYRWDHLSRIKEALSGAEARGEGATTNRPYKQLFSYDALGHLTERSKYRWFLGAETSSDSYTNNRHDPVGQLWQYDADGNTITMPGTAYVYDASGRIVTMTSGIPSTATLSWDGDGRKVKSVEAVWDFETETDITTTSYSIYSTVLGRVLTEFVYSDDPDITVPGFFTRTLVYGDSGGVIAYQMGYGGGSGEVWFEYRDPSNAAHRAITNVGAPSVEQELDPTGANQGVADPATQSIPDEGLLAPYPNTFNPSQPFAAYSIDGVHVPLDTFMDVLQVAFQGNLGLNEALARQSANDANYRRRWVPHAATEDNNVDEVEEGDIVVIAGVLDGHWEVTAIATTPSLAWLGGFPQKTSDPRSIFDKFIAQNPDCAKNVQESGNKLGIGDYLKTPWQITDTLPIYDKPGVIPGQTDPKLSTPRNYFDAHPGWAATTLFDPQGNRAGTFLGEGYHIYWIDNPDYKGPGSPVFVSRPRGGFGKQLILFDESLHNYFHMGHIELANTLGVAFTGSKDIDALMALEAWAKGGCK